MGFYRERVLPHLIRLAMRDRHMVPYRDRVASAAAGRVLEIGVGAGENFRHYRAAVTQLIGLEPDARLAAMARKTAGESACPARILAASAERIPLTSESIDTVVMTWTLCSIADPQAALREIRRVLKRDGHLRFVEHGLAPEPGVQRWQHRLTPVWKHLAGGCHLDRDMPALVAAAGFRLERLETGYMRGPRPLTFMYEGTASPD
jgi:ubiquinone/menaquinone biosynthesis C-methylase UbiE